MGLDQPASAAAFWNIYAATGVRPEFLIGVMAFESGLNPAIPNGAGAPYYGIMQNSGSFITQMTGLSPQEYLTKPASYQLQNVVLPYMEGQVKTYGPLTSGYRVYQSVYCPASLNWAPGLDDVISSPTEHTDCSYSANAVFDSTHKGYITPRDLANVISAKASTALVQNAIRDVYTNAPPGVGSPQDPAFGSGNSNSLLGSLKGILVPAAIVLTAAFIASEIHPGIISDSTRNMRRRLRLA